MPGAERVGVQSGGVGRPVPRVSLYRVAARSESDIGPGRSDRAPAGTRSQLVVIAASLTQEPAPVHLRWILRSTLSFLPPSPSYLTKI